MALAVVGSAQVVWQPVQRLLAPKWLARHVVALVLIAGCLALGWWQWRRASDGNTLSWAYTLEWPLFAAFAGWVWFRAARDDVRTARGEDPYENVRPAPMTPRPARTVRATVVEDDPENAAYNRYLAWLAANPDRKPSEYRDSPG